MKPRSAFIFGLLLLIMVCVLSACGGDTKGNDSTAKTPTATTAQEVHIAMGEMYFKSPVTTFKVGQLYRFVLVNEGKDTHEFTIAPARKEGQTEKDLDAVALLDADQLQPGQTTTREFTFKQPAPKGTLEIECSYPGHYEHGMHIPIVVEQ